MPISRFLFLPRHVRSDTGNLKIYLRAFDDFENRWGGMLLQKWSLQYVLAVWAKSKDVYEALDEAREIE